VQSETAVLATLTHFTQPVPAKWIADLAGLAGRQAETTLEDLTDRALLAGEPAGNTFYLPPLAGKFLRDRRPEAVSQAGGRLAERAYALAVANGNERYDRFFVLEEEWPVLSAALPLLVGGENGRLQTLCGALRNFFNFSGHWDEWLSLERQAEAKALVAGDFNSAGERALRSGWVAYLRNQAAEVLACAARAEGHWRKAEFGTYEQATAIRLRGVGLQLSKNYPAALEAYHQGLDLFRTINPESADVANVVNDIADIERLSYDFAAAERDYGEALRIAHKLENKEGIAMYTGNLGELALTRSEWQAAEGLAVQALAFAEEVGRQELIGFDCWLIAKAMARQSRRADGLPYARRAVEIFTKLQSPENLAAAQAVLKECEVAPAA